jgi:hypothetical protein
MEDKPTLVELMLDLAETHRVKATTQDSEFDRGACSAFRQAAQIIESSDERTGEADIREEYVEELGHASAGGELDG